MIYSFNVFINQLYIKINSEKDKNRHINMAASLITKAQLKSLCTKFSIKNFLADLPRMLNDSFTTIYNCICDFYNPDDHSIEATKLHATYIDATTVVAQNLRFKGDNGEVYNYSDIGNLLSEIESKLESIKHITKEQIDSLNYYPFQPWPLYAEYFGTKPSSPNVGDRVLTTYGVAKYVLDETTQTSSWIDSQVPDGTMYLCEEGLILYKRDENNSRWINLGKYKSI